MTRPSERSLYDRYILGSSTTRGIADALAGTRDHSIVRRRWGIINAIDAVNDTVDVTISGVVVPGVRRAASYAPTVGERVWLDVVGTDVVVVSPIAPSVANDLRRFALSTHVHDSLPRGVVTRGTIPHGTFDTTSERALLEVSFTAEVGRMYMVRSDPVRLTNLNGGNYNSLIAVSYTLDGTTPQTTSTLLPNSPAEMNAAVVHRYETVQSNVTAVFSLVNEYTVRLLLYLKAVSGTARLAFDQVKLSVIDLGIDPGDTGVNRL